MKKAEVEYNAYSDKPWYVSDRQNNKGPYIRDDLTEHSHMMNNGGTYFATKEEAQALCDAYNSKTSGVTVEEGKYYKKADGEKAGPATKVDNGPHGWNVPWPTGDYFYTPEGKSCLSRPEDDIVGEWPCDDPKEENTEVNPQEITVGLTYQCVNGREFTCIYVEGNHAWMKNAGDNESTAYVWNKDTGDTISLSVDTGYNLKRSFVVV